jgi:hypothetical protein
VWLEVFLSLGYMGSVCTLYRLILVVRYLVAMDWIPSVPTKRDSHRASCPDYV